MESSKSSLGVVLSEEQTQLELLHSFLFDLKIYPLFMKNIVADFNINKMF